MAQSPKPKNSAVVSVRATSTTALPPCVLGYSSLIEPDEYDPLRPAFKLNAHLEPLGIEAYVKAIATKCYCEANLVRLKEEAEAHKLPWEDPQDASKWLGAKLKTPKEGFAIQLPYLIIATKAQFKNRQGETIQKTLSCWDRRNTLLDLKALRLGRGSVIQVVVRANVYLSKLIGFPQPKLDLVGIRVLKLVKYGGVQAPEETSEEDIQAVLGDLALDDDLSEYAAGAPAMKAPPGDGGEPAPDEPHF